MAHKTCSAYTKEVKFAMAKEKKKEEKAQKLDTSKWWLVVPYKLSESPCINDRGDPVDLNSEQARDDYRFYKELHIKQDTTEYVGCGAYRYKPEAPTPMIRDCIVYGHNIRNGYFQHNTTSETEAINIVRVDMTKYLHFGDKIK